MKRFVSFYLIVFVTVAALGHPLAAPSSLQSHRLPPVLIPALKPIVVDYDIYVGGIHFISATILFVEQDRKYHVVVTAHTRGFWYKAAPWTTSLDARGTMAQDKFMPAEYVTHDLWGKKPKATRLHFKKNGDVVPEFDPPSHDESHDLVTREQRVGSLDPVTGLLQMLAHVELTQDCNVTVPVFDGKRRFDVLGSNDGVAEIDEENYSAYKGPARLCNVDFKMISGEWKDKHTARFWDQNDKEKPPGREPFHIWMARLDGAMPELPVRLESGSVWGLLVMHLSKWHYADSTELKP
jgi:hypothetical protein